MSGLSAIAPGGGGGGESYKVTGRGMLSRLQANSWSLSSLVPGRDTKSCVVCCNAPTCCPMCGLCPCCDDAEYVKERREASKYIYIRENSLEWNDPEIVLIQSGSCLDPCMYTVKDRVHVVYFDDPMMDRITDQTRCCNECRTCLCGGRGERISLDATCCHGLCVRSSFPCPFLPVCCPAILAVCCDDAAFCFPCAWRREFYVADASRSVYEIKAAIRSAKQRVSTWGVSFSEIEKQPQAERNLQ